MKDDGVRFRYRFSNNVLQPIISWYLYVSSFLCLNSRYYNFRFPPFSEHHHKIGCKIKNTRTFYSCRKLRDLQSYVLNRMNIVHCSFNNTPFGGSDRLAKITSLCGKVSDGDVGLANWHLLMYASPVYCYYLLRIIISVYHFDDCDQRHAFRPN